ncbi:MAG: 4Fe-4S binding protein [Deltaproteobacteria bacterium]|nr:4Fe-4S binding protein [Deltaproteobacteria bacterium]
MLGNEAIARALVENGCSVAASYPGTPASEILSAAVRWRKECDVPMHIQWAVNEKVALEIAYTASIAGLRSAVSMKQVGLNVASDPLMSAAYTGVEGGFLVISADDPGPHSSQTEQDSRLLAMAAKVPVLDPSSPAHAMELVGIGYELSETFRIPAMLRPTTRVCHACQDILPGIPGPLRRNADFHKSPERWAATPAYRYELHRKLSETLSSVAAWPRTAPLRLNPGATGPLAVVASGVASAHAEEILRESGLWDRLPFYRVVQPYPLHTAFVIHLLGAHDEILVLEETEPVIEMQLADRRRVRGRMTGAVSEAGELLPEIVERAIARFAGLTEKPETPAEKGVGRRPTLCAGCPHRSSFYAIKKAAPRGIYPSDIGCYTLGLNLGGVDTVLCMGAAVSQAAGFYQAYRLSGKKVDIVATIGDSTFFHAGIPPLVDAVVQGARFVLVILDNSTTAMTGYQATPATGEGAAGEPTVPVDMEAMVRGCGVEFCKVGIPGRMPEFTKLLKEAIAFSHERGPAVVIAREPCVMDRKQAGIPKPRRKVRVNEECDGCRHCTEQFECPALVYDDGGQRVFVDTLQCTGCGVCLHVCPRGAIVEEGPMGENA